MSRIQYMVNFQVDFNMFEFKVFLLLNWFQHHGFFNLVLVSLSNYLPMTGRRIIIHFFPKGINAM